MVNIFFPGTNYPLSYATMHRLKDVLISHRGEDPVMLHFRSGNKNQVILVGSQFWVQSSSRLVQDLQQNFDQAVKVLTNPVRV